ncbi:Type I restriction-modification system, restriction subunit R [Chitinispirillum alkaliphilum]|nr:Type I restriction-modification system, restriction subunit R [Chitinispirillum alkaliphilum]
MHTGSTGMMTEDQLEQLCLQWFHETGWETLNGPNINKTDAVRGKENYQSRISSYLYEARNSIEYPVH